MKRRTPQRNTSFGYFICTIKVALDILNQEYSIIILLILKNPNASILILQTQEAYTNFKNYQLRIFLA